MVSAPHVVGTLPSIDFESVKMELGNITNCTFLLKTFINMLDTLVRQNSRLQRVSRNESFYSMCVVFMSASSSQSVLAANTVPGHKMTLHKFRIRYCHHITSGAIGQSIFWATGISGPQRRPKADLEEGLKSTLKSGHEEAARDSQRARLSSCGIFRTPCTWTLSAWVAGTPGV